MPNIKWCCEALESQTKLGGAIYLPPGTTIGITEPWSIDCRYYALIIKHCPFCGTELKTLFKEQPHEFVGRSDRWCEICNKPDRSLIHCVNVEEK